MSKLALPLKSATGCLRCKQRKVKCDETKPVCQRCARADYECVYRDIFDVQLRDQTQQAGQRAQQKWRSRAHQPSRDSPTQHEAMVPQSSSGRTSVADTSEATQPNADSSLTSSLNVPYQDIAINRLFFDFVTQYPQSAKEDTVGHMPFLPQMYRNCPSRSVLEAATLTAAHANLSGRTRTSRVPEKGRKHYGLAVKLVKDALEHPIDRDRDETLLAVYLLCVYEIVQYPKHNRGSWGIHLDGVAAVIRAQIEKKPRNTLTPFCQCLARMVTWQMLIKPFREGTTPQLLRVTWVDGWAPTTLASHLASLQYRVASYNAVMRLPDPTSAAPIRWQTQYDEIVADFDSWEVEATLATPFATESYDSKRSPAWLAEILNHDGNPTTTHVYQCFWSEFIWNMWRGARIQLELSRHLGFGYPTQTDREASTRTMTGICEYVCSSLFCILTLPVEGKPSPEDVRDVCGIRGLSCLFPFSQAAKCIRLALMDIPGMSERLSWLQIVLEHLQHDFGVSGSMKLGLFEPGGV